MKRIPSQDKLVDLESLLNLNIFQDLLYGSGDGLDTKLKFLLLRNKFEKKVKELSDIITSNQETILPPNDKQEIGSVIYTGNAYFTHNFVELERVYIYQILFVERILQTLGLEVK